ncbi:MAG: succinate dehydrogenase assembly factor 4 [Gammaproteobacteria bacterium]
MVKAASFWHNYLVTDSESAKPTTSHSAAAATRDSAVAGPESAASASAAPVSLVKVREIGGPAGPDPTRFGDWERRGRCIDF